MPAGAGPAVELDQLLPDGVASAAGMSLQDALERARTGSLTAQRADANARAANAGLTAARLGYMPQVSASFRYTRLSDYTPGTIPAFNTAACLQDLAACQTNPDSFQQNVVLQDPILNQYAMRFSVGVPLSDYIGRQRHALRAAVADADAAEASRLASLQQLELVTTQAYWEVVRARAQLALANESRGVAQERSRQAELQVQTGSATQAQALSASAQASAYDQLIRVAEGRLNVAEMSLRDLLGMEETEPVNLAADLTDLPESEDLDLRELRRAAAAGAPSVEAAQARARAADARADAQRAAMFPSLTAAFGVDYANPNQRIFPQETVFTTTWDAALQVAWSLDGAATSGARLAQQRALAEEQRLAARELELSAGRDAIQAQASLSAALAGVDAQRAAASAAMLNATHASARAQAGVSTELQLRDAEAQRLSARLDLVDALVDAQVAAAQLDVALGRGRVEEDR
tara:strand:+ start:2926 stop:4317 length:1392 start_codon:yes stop_codon:yes gene_type:complete